MAFSLGSAQGRRWFLVSASAALLAACATGPTTRPGPVEPVRVNRVAVLVPLSGPDEEVGRAIGNAARLAMFDTKSQAFELSLFDTAAGGAEAAAQRAIGEGNDLILGPLRSDDVKSVGPVAQRARVPVISFSNDADVAAPGVYVLGFTPTQAVERVVAQAAAAGAKRFAAVVPANIYGERSARALTAAVQRAGGQVVGVETYGRASDAVTAARRLGAKPYDAVLLADSGRVAGLIAPSLRPGARILGTELWAGAELGGTPRLRGAWYAAPTQGRWTQFVQRYRARYTSAVPPRIASLGYDAVLLSVRAARTWAPGRRFPLGAIDDPDGFDGVDGVFRFRSDNVAQRAFEVRQVTASGSTLVSAAPVKF